MKITYTLLLLSLSLVLTAQNKPCSLQNEFNTVQIYDGIIASLERADSNQLCAGIETNLEDLLISNENGILRIRKIAGKKYDKQPIILINYKTINSIEIYGKSDIDTRNLILGDTLSIVLKSGSRFYADCDVKYLSVDVSEGSLLKIDGYALTQNIKSSGKATFSGFELEGEQAEVSATRGGIIKLNISKEITGSSTSTGHISYKGSPRKDVKTSLGGKLVKIEEE